MQRVARAGAPPDDWETPDNVWGRSRVYAWLNEHVLPVKSAKREKEADRLARQWGFGVELDALDREAESVPSG